MSSTSKPSGQTQYKAGASESSSSTSSTPPISQEIRALRYRLSRISTPQLKAMLKNVNRLFAMSARLPDGGNKLRSYRRELLFELGRRQGV